MAKTCDRSQKEKKIFQKSFFILFWFCHTQQNQKLHSIIDLHFCKVVKLELTTWLKMRSSKSTLILLLKPTFLYRRVATYFRVTSIYTGSPKSRSGMHNSNIMAGQKYLIALFKGQKLYVFTTLKGVSNKQAMKKSKKLRVRAKLNASAGHIWPTCRMLCMPGLDCHNKQR